MTNSLWPLGVAIYLGGTVGQALGANLQRKSLTTEMERAEKDPTYQPKDKAQQKMWVFGVALLVFSGVFMSFALFFASQTLLSPLQLFLFVANAVFANLINHEAFGWLGWDGIYLLLVVLGVTMAIVSAPKHTESYTNDEMLLLMHQPGFIAFWYVAGSLICIMYLVRRCILSMGDTLRPWHATVLNMSYGAIAGAFGGINVTLTKTLFSLIVGQFKEGGVLGILFSPLLWATSIVLVGTYVLQIVVTVSGLEEASAIIVISANAVTAEVTAATGGILYFQDYERFDPFTWFLFVGGNAIAIVSVIGLSHLRVRDVHASKRANSIIPLDMEGGEVSLLPKDADYSYGATVAPSSG